MPGTTISVSQFNIGYEWQSPEAGNKYPPIGALPGQERRLEVPDAGTGNVRVDVMNQEYT